MKKINTIPFIAIALLLVVITACKRPKPPTAIAGPDQVITLPNNSISLDGSRSNDPDGSISSFLWKKKSGPASFNITAETSVNTTVDNLEEGIYQFELMVTDDDGLFDKDIIQISVIRPGPNRPPVANAGPDQIITLPTNTVTLDGSASTDPDNNIANYAWSKISGPLSYSFTNANAVQMQVTTLVAGDYKFELKVTDGDGLNEKDTIQVTVQTNTSDIDIYVAGMQNDLPVYWKNGQAIILDNDGWNFTGTSIAVDGSNVYVAGSRNGLMYTEFAAKYWKNNQGTPLGTYAGTGSITVVGSDVYVAGWDIDGFGSHYVAKYWKNGQAVPLTNGNIDAYASSIVVVGNDVYVAGQEGNVAKYWKNGQAISLTSGTNQSYANSIAVVGNDIYVAGSETDGSSHHVAKYWKNGQAISLTTGVSYATATSLAVVGSDVYVAGWEGDFYGMVGGTGSVARYWKNGQAVSLTNGTTYAYTGSIVVFENDVYVAGYEIAGGQYQPKYWKNGSAIPLSNGSGGGWATSIVVIRN
jgi:hypothetical protein